MSSTPPSSESGSRPPAAAAGAFARQASTTSSSHTSSSSSAAGLLTPSQTIRSAAPNQKTKKKARNKGGAKPAVEAPAASTAPTNGGTTTTPNNETNAVPANKKKKARQRKKKNGTKPDEAPPTTGSDTLSEKTAEAKAPPPQQPHPKNANRNKARRHKKANNANNARKYPWRSQIPAGSMDPITLDPLDQLSYPPLALAAQEPYEAVPEWPVPADENASKPAAKEEEETEEARQRRVLQEQWGPSVPATETAEDSATTTTPAPPKDRHYNLYDGRALAYYMVSQLQFIDPLNRRDLTRDELVNLDRYLRRHGFFDLNVTEAYDYKGVTLSTAGAAANTATGRAEILQQEAAVLLQALFGGHSVTAAARRPPTNHNSLAQQYQAYAQSQERPSRAATRRFDLEEVDVGIYGDGGLLVIDDNLNPGLRGNAPEFTPDAGDTVTSGRAGASTLWSASHIAARHNHATRMQAQEFPSLSETAAPSRTDRSSDEPGPAAAARKNLPKAKTLSKIGGLVKETTAEEKQRQWEAREDARRKAIMSNLTFGSNPAIMGTHQHPSLPIPTSVTTVTAAVPSEGQVERNRAFADALGVLPATVRQTINSGWARPTDPVKEFGNELQATIYPDALILQARERLALVVKLERQWKTFLNDDKAASRPLNPMDRPTRIFVHHYSDFWHLKTESFDPEPKRYIHCVKVRETMAPYPLLSTAAKQWTGPRYNSTSMALTEHALQQTAGQTTTPPFQSRNLPAPPQRQPLQLQKAPPGSSSAGATAALGLSGSPLLTDEEKTSARFDGLASRPRAKLQLQPRTVPLEMPPFAAAASSSFDIQEQMQRQQERAADQARQKEATAAAQREALEAAFASDDEEGFGNGHGNDDDSDAWVEQAPLFQGSEEEVV